LCDARDIVTVVSKFQWQWHVRQVLSTWTSL